MSETLGEFIKRRLGEIKPTMSQADLARCSGISPSMISMLANDNAPTSKKSAYNLEPANVRKLAQCLQCAPAELLAKMGYLTEAEVGDVYEGRLIELYRSLSAGFRELIFAIGHVLIEKDKAGGSDPRVLAPNDPRADTAKPVSAGQLKPQVAKNNSSKRRGGNGG